jgi:CMP-N-acetylneuraminic acid synthetase/spore coat polysaccharide biosynthesis predicted glycosyltransferase SpsG
VEDESGLTLCKRSIGPMKEQIVAIVPARGGSKGISRKNIRMLAGKPLIAHILEAAQCSEYLERTIVSSDDSEILETARRFGAEAIRRPKKLSKDDVPLDPVIYHVLQKLESKGYYPTIVVTLQPTSPTLRVETIDEAIRKLIEEELDTVISVKDATHLYWIEKDGKFVPLFKERKNRQFLPKILKETGSIIASRRGVISENNRIGKNISFIHVSPNEAVDIDSPRDWWLTEKILNQKRIVFRVDGSQEIGLGHIYRALTLAQRIMDHQITFLMDSRYTLGISIVEQHKQRVVTFSGDAMPLIESLNPDIIINDILDTDTHYMQALKRMGKFVVNFEDLGEGAQYANLVINALYDSPVPYTNHLWGSDYVCLRDEFHSRKKNTLRPEVKNILVTFGGVDEQNLTCKVLSALHRCNTETKVTVILGLGYIHHPSLNDFLENTQFTCKVKKNVRFISYYMEKADLVFTSCGRTVYEVAAIGTPCITLAQNDREMGHLFANINNGIVNLGLGKAVDEDKIIETTQELIRKPQLRMEMRKKMERHDLKSGITRVLKAIFQNYDQFREDYHA